jgi:hypothetical protein
MPTIVKESNHHRATAPTRTITERTAAHPAELVPLPLLLLRQSRLRTKRDAVIIATVKLRSWCQSCQSWPTVLKDEEERATVNCAVKLKETELLSSQQMVLLLKETADGVIVILLLLLLVIVASCCYCSYIVATLLLFATVVEHICHRYGCANNVDKQKSRYQIVNR